MLVTRQCEAEQHPWSNKFEAIFHKPTSPRMSSYNSQLSTQPDWHGHYSYLPHGENNIFGQPFEQISGTSTNNNTPTQQRIENTQEETASNQHRPGQSGSSSDTSHSRPLDPLGLRQPKTESPIQDAAETRDATYSIKAEPAQEDPLASTDTPGLAHASGLAEPTPSIGQGQDVASSQTGNEDAVVEKDEDDDVLDDDEMVEAEGDPPTQPQTAAERTAARRKMKRFRLTHQQTRFLMSEFAKQPHPDAAHRERLSREIPGLSPRQVQVWFQNRRAKIKRLTADDRDRMIKMRAVPDDFDNVQALHSPYGAVHALGTPMSSSVDFSTPSYSDHLMRPLMVDTMRRGDGDDHLSPTGLSPGFGNIGFTPGTMGSTDILSPLSPASTDRGYYSGHLTSPLGTGPRSSNPFARQNSLDAGPQMHSQTRQPIRPLQPLHLRDTMSRSRTETLQSPLRSSMSWKGDSIDYTSYSSAGGAPGITGRHQSVYQSDHVGSNAGSGLNYEPNSYSGSGLQSSPTNINYSSVQSPTLQQPPHNRSRLRAASATLPLGLDLRNQYRPISSGHSLQSTSQSSASRAVSTAPYGNPSSYTTGYPSAPLTAPVDFSLPRTPSIRTSVPDYSPPQMSAPIAPPQDFTAALHGNLGSSHTRTPMRDSFGSGPLTLGPTHSHSERNDDYYHEGIGVSGAGLKRERNSFSLPQGHHSSPGTAPSSYGHTT